MTAIATLSQGDVGHVFACGAHYTPDGIVRHFGTKIFRTPGHGVIAIRGFAPMAVAYLQGATDVLRRNSFDELISGYREGWEKMAPALRALHDDAVDQHETVICGWSESQKRIETYVAQASPMNGKPAFQPETVPPNSLACFGPMPSPEKLSEVGWQFMPAINLEPANAGRLIFEAMRRTEVNIIDYMHDFEPVLGSAVGGFLEQATVTRDGVTIEKIHDWPDRIGHRIDPYEAR